MFLYSQAGLNKLEEPVYLMDTKICSFWYILYEIKTWTIAKSISNKTKQKTDLPLIRIELTERKIKSPIIQNEKLLTYLHKH